MNLFKIKKKLDTIHFTKRWFPEKRPVFHTNLFNSLKAFKVNLEEKNLRPKTSV